MDNSVEGKDDKLGGIVYSSQDILGNSLAGKKNSLFTRVKKMKPFFGRKEKTAKIFVPNDKPSQDHTGPISKKQLIKIVIVVFAGLFLVGGAIITVFLINNSRNNNNPTEITEEEEEPAYTEEEMAYTEDIPEEIAALKPDQADKNIGIADYASKQINYINALVDAGLLKTAADEMESVMSEIEMSPDAFTDCQLASAYRTSVRIQEIDIAKRRADGQDVTDPAEEEDENSDVNEDGEQYYTASVIERMKKATEACGE